MVTPRSAGETQPLATYFYTQIQALHIHAYLCSMMFRKRERWASVRESRFRSFSFLSKRSLATLPSCPPSPGRLHLSNLRPQIAFFSLPSPCPFLLLLLLLLFAFCFFSQLEGMLGEEPQALEYSFVFCLIWACGGCLHEKDGIDYRRQFNTWWRNEWKTIKFPSKGTVFEYYVDQVRLPRKEYRP